MKIKHPLETIKTRATRTLLRLGALLLTFFLTTAAQAQLTNTNGIIYFTDTNGIIYTTIYTTNGDNTLTVSGYTGPGGAVVIPERYDAGTNGSLPVCAIRYSAFANCSGLTSVTIPGSVTSIGNSAFANCSRLTSVTILGSVTNMGVSVFANCSVLTSVTISQGVTSLGDSAFANCSRLTNVTIPGSVTSIGTSAFANCSGLTSVTISQGVTSLGDWAFDNCSRLASVTIPSSVTYIGEAAFGYCSGLTNITVAAQNPNYSSVAEVLFDKSQTTLLQYPGGRPGSYAIPSSVTSLGDWAFGYCSGLTNIVIPSSVTSLGFRAFFYCSGLTSVTIPGSVTNMGSDAFFGCSGLTSVTISQGVTYIGDWAFATCSRLTSVTIPNSVTYIGNDAFLYCSGLTSVTVPSSVTYIGEAAFGYCSGLTNIMVAAQNLNYSSVAGVLFDQSQTTLLQYPGGRPGSYAIPSSVTHIGSDAFCGSGLTSVIIPSRVTYIGYWAFEGCSNLTSVYFQGDAPTPASDAAVFYGASPTVYYLAGTTGWGPTFGGQPTAVYVLPILQPLALRGTNLILNWTVQTGKTYTVEYRADLTSGDWITVTNLTATQLNMSLTLPVTGRQGFYRIGMEP